MPTLSIKDRVRVYNDGKERSGREGTIVMFFINRRPAVATIQLDDGGKENGKLCSIVVNRLIKLGKK